MTTPLNFKITEAGLAEAASKQGQGIRLALTTFKVSSAYGYVVTGAEAVMPGTVLYTGPVTRYDKQPGGSLAVNCQLSPQSGPFEFGSIGIFSDSGVLVALASIAQPQQKYPSLGQAVSSTISFDCLLKLGQGTAVFDLSYADRPTVFDFGPWSAVTPESGQVDQRVHTFFVDELDDKNDLTMLVKRPGGMTWSVQTNMFLLSGALPYSGLTQEGAVVDQVEWEAALKGLPQQGTFVVEFPGSVFRKVSVSGSTARSLAFTSAWPAATVGASGSLRLFTNSLKLAAA